MVSLPRESTRALSGACRASVVLPTVGREALLYAVRSLAQQRIRLEVLLVDDSKRQDRTAVERILASARTIAASAGHEVVMLRTSGLGLAAARNHGLARASTPYVLFLDDDDLWCSHHAERLVEELDFGASFVTAPTGVVRVHGDGPPVLTEVGFGWRELGPKLRVTNVIAPSSVGVRRDSMVRFDVELDVQEDWDAWLRMLASGHKPRLTSRLTCGYVKDTREGMASTVRAGIDPQAQRSFVRNRRRILGLDGKPSAIDDARIVRDRSRWEGILQSWAEILESGGTLSPTYYEEALAALFGPPQLEPCCDHDFGAAMITDDGRASV